jgi:dienelactone hydrolase
VLDDRAEQALDAVRLLRGRVDIAAGRVGLWGQSQGGWIVPLAASRAGPSEIAFAIPQSCPGIGIAEQDRYSVEHLLRAAGQPEETVGQALDYMCAFQAAATRGDAWETVEPAIIAPVRDAEWFQGLAGDFGPEDWASAILWAAHPYDPAPALEQVTCPLLAIFGELDLLLPVAESVAIFERCLAANPDVTIRVFPGANHRLKLDATGDFAPGYLETLSDWLMPRVGLA